MNQSAWRRLWFPIATLSIFAALALFNRDILFQFRDEALDQSHKVLGYAIQIGIWLSTAHFLNRLLIVFFWDGLVLRTLGAPVPRLVKDVFTILLYITAITGIVGFVFEKSVTGFWTTSGIVGLVLGFALKNMILDVFTGLAINLDRPYKIGDWIMVHGNGSHQTVTGQIMEINWRTTRLHTEDDSMVILPNSMLGTMMVTNYWGAGPGSRFETEFCLDYSIPTERACRVLQAGAKAAAGKHGILETPEPNVVVSGTNALGVVYKIRYWTSKWTEGVTRGGAQSHVNRSILAHLHQAGITPAYPKQDVFYAEMPTRHLNAAAVEDRVALLRQTELFQNLEDGELSALANAMHQRRFRKGEKLITQGESGHSMFILSEGLLHVYLNVSTNGSQTELKVGQIIPGEFFGEMSLLTGEPRSATVVAATDVVAHEITKEHMNELLRRNPALAQTITRIVAARRVSNSEKMASATPEERIEETESLAQQLMGKMKAFFRGVF